MRRGCAPARMDGHALLWCAHARVWMAGWALQPAFAASGRRGNGSAALRQPHSDLVGRVGAEDVVEKEPADLQVVPLAAVPAEPQRHIIYMHIIYMCVCACVCVCVCMMPYLRSRKDRAADPSGRRRCDAPAESVARKRKAAHGRWRSVSADACVATRRISGESEERSSRFSGVALGLGLRV